MATTSRKIFIDSSALIAFIDRGTTDHLKASKAIEDLASIGYRLYTSSQVITDTYVLLLRNSGNAVALEFLQTMLQSGIEILFPQKADLITAHRILRVNRDEQIPLTEAINATLMQRKGITQILTLSNWNKLFGTNVSNLVIN
ncbi:type II toxin-antitoxin system VapC family toxin [Candidatus Daviesbacteria bacterium]|nr:type II toxin-antitoxin system VapC family toxin [Candidatus Daviesbacteria bacterium]